MTNIRSVKWKSPEWTPAQDRMLAKLWKEEKTSREIGEVLDRNQNAVLARAARIGLPRRYHGRARPPKHKTTIARGLLNKSEFKIQVTKKTAAERRAHSEALSALDAAFTPLPISQPKTLFDLGRHECRWPLGETLGKTQLFCGCKTGDAVYCETHAAVAFRPKPEKVI